MGDHLYLREGGHLPLQQLLLIVDGLYRSQRERERERERERGCEIHVQCHAMFISGFCSTGSKYQVSEFKGGEGAGLVSR